MFFFSLFFFHSICTRTILVKTFYSSFKFAGISQRDPKVIHGVNGSRSYRWRGKKGGKGTNILITEDLLPQEVSKENAHESADETSFIFLLHLHTQKFSSFMTLNKSLCHSERVSQSGKVLLSFPSPSGFFSVCFKCKVGASSYYVFFRIWYNATLILVAASKYYTDLIITWN